MISLKWRRKILNKIAQTAPGTINAPVAAPVALIPPPPAFQASGAWGWMSNVYNSPSVIFIDNLINLLNTALHYSSNGSQNWQILRNNSFNIDPSGAHSIDTKNLLNLSKMIYQNYLNGGNQFPSKVSGKQISDWNSALSQSQAFLNLSHLNPTGVIAQKIPSNLKDNIFNILRELARYNPIRPQ